MRTAELLRLVWLNIRQNKFKAIMTSIGIVVGAATIVLVIGIGQGSRRSIAEQFAELNAGEINVSYEYEGEDPAPGGGVSLGHMGQMIGRMFSGSRSGGGTSAGRPESGSTSAGRPESGSTSAGRTESGGTFAGRTESGGTSAGRPESGSTSAGRSGAGGAGPSDGRSQGREENRSPDRTQDRGGEEGEKAEGEKEADNPDQEEETADGESRIEGRLNQEKILLTMDDVEDILQYVPGITGATISYSVRSTVEGGNLTEAETYTVAGVKPDYEQIGKLALAEGTFFTGTQESAKEKVCVLGASAAEELFDDPAQAVGRVLYIADREYTVTGVLSSCQSVSAGITADTSIFVPYETGMKYLTEDPDPVITVIAGDVNVLESVIGNVQTVLEENYINATFTFEDSGSKMEAARTSGQTLTMLLTAMAVIVFGIGGIGIMNVLFVSVKERTEEIGILKAIGTGRGDILAEFLIEAAVISLIGGLIGVALSMGAIPFLYRMGVRVEADGITCLIALCFAVLTGTVFGIYPAWKASRLEPVRALNQE